MPFVGDNTMSERERRKKRSRRKEKRAERKEEGGEEVIKETQRKYRQLA
jgi:hypothetical protein